MYYTDDACVNISVSKFTSNSKLVSDFIDSRERHNPSTIMSSAGKDKDFQLTSEVSLSRQVHELLYRLYCHDPTLGTEHLEFVVP